MGKDKDFAEITEQIRIQKSRGLKISDTQKMAMYLETNNYFDFINGFETLFLVDPKDKTKGYLRGTSLKDFELLNSFDLELSKEIMNCLCSFEKKLKSQLSHHFSRIHCNTLSKTLNYQDKAYYTYPVPGSYEYSYLPRQYNDDTFVLFAKYNKYGSKIPKGVGVSYADSKKKVIDYIAAFNQPPLWVIIKQLMFGDLYIMVSLLDDSVLEPILKSYGLTLTDRDYFLNCLDVLKSLRNHCAHFELVNRFRTHNKTDLRIIHSKLPIRVVSYFPTGPIFQMKLYDTLLVLSQFTSIRRPVLCIYKLSIINLFRRRVSLNYKLLERMGRRKFTDWIVLMNRNC